MQLNGCYSRARDRAELVTDDKAALKQQLEAVTGERIAALEAVELERVKGREAGMDAGRDMAKGTETPERTREPKPEKAQEPKSIEREFSL